MNNETQNFMSYSQHQEDAFIARNILLPRIGFYLDIGCGDPVHGSNTAFLRDHGWKGLAVDGNPNFVHRWNEVNAPFIAAVIAGRTGCIGFALNEANPGMSRIDDAAPGTRCRTIEDFLTKRFQIGKIDFLSIDIEGHEFEVLSGFDFALHNPEVIVAEYATLQPDGKTVVEDFRVKEMLEKIGYRVVHQTVANLIFHRE